MWWSRPQGFTLVELIIVLVLLAVLAVVALPRFLDTSDSARQKAIEMLAANLETAIIGVKLEATLNGVGDNPRSGPSDLPVMQLDGRPVELKFGYPEAFAEAANAADVLDIIQINGDLSVCYSTNCVSGNSSRVKIGFDVTENTGCYVRYSEPGGTGAPSATEYGLIIVDVGC